MRKSKERLRGALALAQDCASQPKVLEYRLNSDYLGQHVR